MIATGTVLAMGPKVCVVTGGTAGIGRALAVRIAASGAHVVLLGRSTERGRDVVRQIEKASGGRKASFHQVDLADFEHVRDVADEITRRHGWIDVLVNNAGARNDRFVLTPAGLELTFAANHLAHFLLTCLLLDRLVAAGQGRIIKRGVRQSCRCNEFRRLDAARSRL